MESIAKIYKGIGTSKDYLVELIGAYEDSLLGGISRDYSKSIAEAIADDVARDVHETADHEDWNIDDVRLAVGRVLCKRLGISV